MGKKRQKKTEQQENPNVAEAARIRISQILEQFRAAKDQGIPYILAIGKVMDWCCLAFCLVLAFFN